MNRLNHLQRSDSQVLCGAELDEEVEVINIACPCGRPQCEFPVNCPVCIAIRDKKAN